MSTRRSAATRAGRPRPASPSKRASVSLRQAAAKRLGNSDLRRLLQELVRDPAAAHRDWARMSKAERQAVANVCGEPFANAFDVPPNPQASLTYLQPRNGRTPEHLRAQGYCLAGPEATGNAAYEVEDWLHPSGEIIRRDVSGQPAHELADSRDVDQDEDERDGLRVETRPDGVEVMTLPDDAQKLLRIARRSSEDLVAYCDTSPYELFADLPNSEDEVAEYFKTVHLIQSKVDAALQALERMRNGPQAHTLSEAFWQQVAAIKRQNALAVKQCCDAGVRGTSFGCPISPDNP